MVTNQNSDSNQIIPNLPLTSSITKLITVNSQLSDMCCKCKTLTRSQNNIFLLQFLCGSLLKQQDGLIGDRLQICCNTITNSTSLYCNDMYVREDDGQQC